VRFSPTVDIANPAYFPEIRRDMVEPPPDFRFRIPWHPTDQPLDEELFRELGKHHRLYGMQARAIARRQDNDDVLFALSGGDAPAPLAVVHLTWSGHPDQHPEYPSTALYLTFEGWVARCMTPDAEDWRLSEPGADL
jgi:hypothetical protein